MNKSDTIARDGASALPPASLLQVRDGPSLPLLMQYWRIIVRWHRVIIGAVLVSLLMGVAVTLLMTRMYTATVTVEIAREEAQILKMDGLEPKNAAADQEFYQTQYGLLASRSLADRVVRDLRLANNQAFLDMFGIKRPVATGAGERRGNDAVARDAAEALLDHISISPVRLSRLVSISFSSPDAAFSARVANAWARLFIESSLERRYETTAYARRFLEERLTETRARLDESERKLVAYAADQRIISVGSASTDPKVPSTERPLLADDLVAFNAGLATATAERVAVESRARQARSSRALPEDLTTPAIATLRQDRAQAAADYEKMLSQFEPGYPPAQALKAQITQFDRSIVREEARVRDSIQTQFREAVDRENAMAQQVEALKNNFLNLRRRSIQYNIYQRDVDTNRSLYDGLLQRYKEIGIAGGIGANNISIVDEAEVPEAPSRPRPLINLLLALVGGAAVGFGLAFVLEQIDEVITDPGDLEATLNLPLLGAIPSVDGDLSVVEALSDRKSPISEAYMSAQTSLQFSTADGVPRSLMITSTRPAEGKSTTAFAIAQCLARLNRRTLLIDGDMRSPSVHVGVGIDNERGLSNLLSGNASLVDVTRESGIDNLAVVSAGPPPPNAAELLSSDRIEQVIADALRYYDNVVVDAPPVMGLADAPLIASKVAGTIFVVESRGIRAGLGKVAVGRLQNAQAHILGAILTKFSQKHAHFGYGYDYGYGYGQKKTGADV
ncbi:GumC family protein [Sphingomonas flavalba]|uniref:GumC family protein n=1 Tax=Sphingomonas flavalba TaxID=2559804 RepID=UPI0039E035CB